MTEDTPLLVARTGPVVRATMNCTARRRAHCNEVDPHPALGYRSPGRFIRAILTA